MAIIIHIHNIYVDRSFPEMHDFDTSNLTHLSNDIFEEYHDDMNWKNLEWDWSILHPMKFALFGLLFPFYFFKEPHIWNFTNSIFSNNLYWGGGVSSIYKRT